MEQMTQEQILDQCASDLSEMMLHLTMAYKGYEVRVAEMLTRQLASYVVIAAREPKKALEQVANAIKNTNWSKIKAAHFGYEMGYKEPQNLIKIAGNKTVHIGEIQEPESFGLIPGGRVDDTDAD